LKAGQAVAALQFEVIQLRNTNAVDAAQVLESLLNLREEGRATVVAQPDSNILLVRSSPDWFPRIREIIAKLDEPQRTGEAALRTRFLSLRHASAANVANVVRGAYGSTDGRSASRGSAANSWAAGKSLSIGVDNRTNSLVLVGPQYRLDEIEVLVDRLEAAAQASAPPGARLVQLKYAAAGEVAKVLREIYGSVDKSVGFSSDGRTNRLVIRCPPSLAEEINALVRELDAKPAMSK
jgi:type II secretory pathway component GspD/PulD (secretin)